MKEILNQLFDHKRLDRKQAKSILVNISKGLYNAPQIAAFISVYLMRNISVNELTGFRDALLELCLPIDLEGVQTIDVCGTGGDGKNTFNISTLSAFVLAGANYKVSKHGNYGVSSICGSSNVLEYLGYKFSNQADHLKTQLEQTNICFLHAPLFHEALKSVGPIRKELGVKTFFNMLGPLVNPARPSHQMVGVFSIHLQRIYAHIFDKGDTKFSIVHALDGYDEISLTGDAKIINNAGEQILNAKDFGLKRNQPKDIFGGHNLKEAADIFISLLSGKGTVEQINTVCANTALAIQCINPIISREEAIEEAKSSIRSGRALNVLKKLITLSNNVS